MKCAAILVNPEFLFFRSTWNVEMVMVGSTFISYNHLSEIHNNFLLNFNLGEATSSSSSRGPSSFLFSLRIFSKIWASLYTYLSLKNKQTAANGYWSFTSHLSDNGSCACTPISLIQSTQHFSLDSNAKPSSTLAQTRCGERIVSATGNLQVQSTKNTLVRNFLPLLNRDIFME